MAEVQAWITINGQHIPIMKGESKSKAVAKFIKNKKSEQRTDLNDKKWKIAKKLDKAYSGMSNPSERHRLEREYNENENKLKQLNKRKEIKGRAKTTEELKKDFSKLDINRASDINKIASTAIKLAKADKSYKLKETASKKDISLAKSIAKELGYSEGNYKQFLQPTYVDGYSKVKGKPYTTKQLEAMLKRAKKNK